MTTSGLPPRPHAELPTAHRASSVRPAPGDFWRLNSIPAEPFPTTPRSEIILLPDRASLKWAAGHVKDGVRAIGPVRRDRLQRMTVQRDPRESCGRHMNFGRTPCRFFRLQACEPAIPQAGERHPQQAPSINPRAVQSGCRSQLTCHGERQGECQGECQGGAQKDKNNGEPAPAQEGKRALRFRSTGISRIRCLTTAYANERGREEASRPAPHRARAASGMRRSLQRQSSQWSVPSRSRCPRGITRILRRASALDVRR